MLLKIAWRNVWRNARRSLIILISIIVGVVAILLYDSLSIGMIHQMLDNQIGTHVSHLQIHRNGFQDNKIIQNDIPDVPQVEAVLQQTDGIAHYSRRVVTFGILSSATSSAGVSIVGIEPQQEARVTSIETSIIEGAYLSGAAHEIVIGKPLAEKLEVGLGDKVVATSSQYDGRIGQDIYRVIGIFETFSSEFDKTSIYIAMDQAQKLLVMGQRISEFAIICTDLEAYKAVQQSLESALNGGTRVDGEPPPYEIFSYRELLPLLVMQVDVYYQAIFVFYAIIGIAMVFGIINTMLMSVFERIQEFGVLMAMGMKGSRIFLMILLEALLLGVLGSVLGAGIGYLFYLWMAAGGIDLAAFSDGLRSFGTGTVIYPQLNSLSVTLALLVAPVFSVLGAIYPAWRAVRLDPMNAIRYV